MFSSERHAQILSCLEKNNSISVQELSARLYASPSTIRRDLTELEAQGFLRRIHGGAVLTAGSTFDTPASLRRIQQLTEKRRIAELATRFLKPSASYFFDSSSTSCMLAQRLADYPDVKIATNGVGILSSMSSSDRVSIISCGGYLRSPWDELTGNVALRAIEGMNADIFFFSCAGFSPEQGSMELSDDNVAVKRAFFRNSAQHILLCDSSKFGRRFFYNLFSIQEIDYVVTDRCPSDPLYRKVLGNKLIF